MDLPLPPRRALPLPLAPPVPLPYPYPYWYPYPYPYPYPCPYPYPWPYPYPLPGAHSGLLPGLPVGEAGAAAETAQKGRWPSTSP